MQQEKQEPVLIIECPDGSSIRIFQELSETYIKDLLDEFTKREGVTIIKTVQYEPGTKRPTKFQVI